MLRIYVPLDRETFDFLNRIARAERRHPRDQAAIMLRAALRRQAPDQQEVQRDAIA